MNNLMPDENYNYIYNDDYRINMIDEIREKIINGTISDFIFLSLDENEKFTMMNFSSSPLIGAGMLEAGKYAILNRDKKD